MNKQVYRETYSMRGGAKGGGGPKAIEKKQSDDLHSGYLDTQEIAVEAVSLVNAIPTA